MYIYINFFKYQIKLIKLILSNIIYIDWINYFFLNYLIHTKYHKLKKKLKLYYTFKYIWLNLY
jgi:hypothetical protein